MKVADSVGNVLGYACTALLATSSAQKKHFITAPCSFSCQRGPGDLDVGAPQYSSVAPNAVDDAQLPLARRVLPIKGAQRSERREGATIRRGPRRDWRGGLVIEQRVDNVVTRSAMGIEQHHRRPRADVNQGDTLRGVSARSLEIQQNTPIPNR